MENSTTPRPDGGPFRGIHPMLYAFFDRSGALDRSALERQVETCVANGAHGIAALGLATEVGKLSAAERRDGVRWTVEAVRGRLPLAATVGSGPVADQIAFGQFARDAGADWLILQPPLERGRPESELLAHLDAVMAALAGHPVGLQNAPEYMGVGLSPAGIVELAERHPHFVVLKGEGPVVHIRAAIEQTGARLAVFNGRNGLELPDNFRAGCAGMIPCLDTVDRQVGVCDAMQAGRHEEAERIYRDALPAIAFAMQSLDTLTCYGKRLAALRMGMGEAIHDRAPALQPTAFGVECVRRYAAALGPLA